jgi:hypothetical protein
LNRELKNLEDWWPNVSKSINLKIDTKRRGRKPKIILESKKADSHVKKDQFKSPLTIS